MLPGIQAINSFTQLYDFQFLLGCFNYKVLQLRRTR